VRLKCHAFHDERFGALRGGHRDGLLLFDHVRPTGAVHGHLAAVRQDEPRNGAGGLGHAPNASLAEARCDQPRDTGLATRPVYVNANRNPA
jgi:hypothetical protein